MLIQYKNMQNFKFYCKIFEVIRSVNAFYQLYALALVFLKVFMKCSVRISYIIVPIKNTFSRTTWSQQRACPRDHAVAGIRTQYEKDKGVGDDTAMNNICVTCKAV